MQGHHSARLSQRLDRPVALALLCGVPLCSGRVHIDEKIAHFMPGRKMRDWTGWGPQISFGTDHPTDPIFGILYHLRVSHQCLSKPQSSLGSRTVVSVDWVGFSATGTGACLFSRP